MLFIFSEDFESFFAMVQKAANYIKDHPVPPQVLQRQQKFWKKRNGSSGASAGTGR
jgi:hypothetical protein